MKRWEWSHESARKGLNATSGAQFADVPSVKSVFFSLHCTRDLTKLQRQQERLKYNRFSNQNNNNRGKVWKDAKSIYSNVFIGVAFVGPKVPAHVVFAKFAKL